MGRHYPGKALRIRSRPNWQIAIAWEPGRPVTADWRYPDPEKLRGETWERRKALAAMLAGLERQLRAFMQLPFRSLDEISLRERLRELGQGLKQAEFLKAPRTHTGWRKQPAFSREPPGNPEKSQTLRSICSRCGGRKINSESQP
jgi:hypothetical protein